MSREAFYDGIFELVDLWTQTVVPDEYVSTPTMPCYRTAASVLTCAGVAPRMRVWMLAGWLAG